MEEHITSIRNPLVKQILRLQQKAAERKKTRLFVAEGRREVSLALSANMEPVHIVVCKELFANDHAYPVRLDDPSICPVVVVSRPVYNKLAYRDEKEGILLVGKQRLLKPGALQLADNPLLLVLEGVEKPGNLGAVFRTADAAGVDALILAGTRADMYNPNAIRSSLGCVFTVPSVNCSSKEAIQWITAPANWKDNKTPVVLSAALQTTTNYFDADMTGPTVLVFGTEDKGLSAQWRAISNATVRIPMAGSIDSLNVAASVAVLTFEAIRQRHKATGSFVSQTHTKKDPV